MTGLVHLCLDGVAVATLQTPLCALFGIDVPIIQAPIGSWPELSSAVSNAGGLGMLGLSWDDPSEVRRLIRETSNLTASPFGMNLKLDEDQHDRLEAGLEEGVKVVSLFWGRLAADDDYVRMAHQAGALVTLTVGSALEARLAAKAGVDVVVAQGLEAGGHVWGQVSTLALVPAVVDAVAPVPVVAAGGIGDGRGLAAVLALGAQAGWVGTRFLLAEEAFIHPTYRSLLIEASESDTVHSSLFDIGWENSPHRTITNSTWRRWKEAGGPSPGARPGEGETVAWDESGEPIGRYDASYPSTGWTGDVEATALYAGQTVGLVREVLPAAEIVARLVEEAEAALRSARGLVD